MEEAICGEFGLIKAWKADKKGNLIFRYVPSGLKICILSLHVYMIPHNVFEYRLIYSEGLSESHRFPVCACHSIHKMLKLVVKTNSYCSYAVQLHLTSIVTKIIIYIVI
jgi:hypothetical protein